MLTLYILSAVIAGGLIILSAVTGLGSHGDAPDFDHDVHTDFDHDVHVDADHDIHTGHDSIIHHDVVKTADGWLPFLSLRFWTYFFGAGGVAGLLLSVLGASAEPLTLILSAGTGLLMGYAAFIATRLARRADLDSKIGEKDFIGAHGRIMVATRDGQMGKVRVEIKGEILDVVALSDNGEDIEHGEDVFIVGFDANQARVVRQKEILELKNE